MIGVLQSLLIKIAVIPGFFRNNGYIFYLGLNYPKNG